VNVNLQGVQRNRVRVLGDLEVDYNISLKGEFLEVGLQSEVVVLWDNIGGEELSALDVDPTTSHFGTSMGTAHVSSVRTMADSSVLRSIYARTGDFERSMQLGRCRCNRV